MEEIISLNGSSFKIWYNSPQGRSKAIKSLQSNLVQNPGFETVNPTAQFQPSNWASVINSGTAVFPYNSPTDLPGRTGKGAAIVASETSNAYWVQTVPGISPGTSYTLTAFTKTTSIIGVGAYIEIDWFAGTTYLSNVTSTTKTGTLDWTSLSVTGVAPAGATSANIALILNGSGTVIYDDISLTGGSGCGACSPSCPTGTCQSGYICSGGSCVPVGGCTPNVTPCSPTCTSGYCPSGQVCSGGTCIPTSGGTICDPVTCPSTTNYCLFGTCIPKTYVLYGGIGFGALFILSLIKK